MYPQASAHPTKCADQLRILRILRMSLRILRMSYVFYVWITYILRMLTYISSAAKFWDFQNSRCGSAYVCGSCGLNFGWIRMLTDDTDPCGCLRICIRKGAVTPSPVPGSGPGSGTGSGTVNRTAPYTVHGPVSGCRDAHASRRAFSNAWPNIDIHVDRRMYTNSILV